MDNRLLLHRSVNIVDVASEYGKTVAVVALFILTVVVAVNAISRKLANIPILYADEISHYMLATVVFLAMGFCTKIGGHIKLSLILDRVKADVRRRMLAIMMGVSMFWVFGLTYAMWNLWLWDISTGRTSGGTIPIWIPGIVYVIGMTLFCLQVPVEVVRTWKGKNYAEESEH